MAKYYKNSSSSTAVNGNMEREGEDNVTEMSGFDRHHKTLLMDDAKEGWASELCHYLGTMQHDVKKDTDLVE